MRVCVPRESGPGEHRVALVPETVAKLGCERVRGGRRAGRGRPRRVPGRAVRGRGSAVSRTSPVPSTASRRVLRVGSPNADEVGAYRPGMVLVGFLAAADRSRRDRPAARARRRRVRDGVDPADHARAVDGRAVVAGDRRRVQGGAAGGGPQPEAVPDDDDRGGDDRPGARPRARRRRRGPAGDRDGAASRRGRLGVRRAARGRGAGRVAGCDVPRSRDSRRGDRGRLRARADGGAAAGAAGGARGADPRVRRRRHDGGRAGTSGAAADSRRRRSSRCARAR